MADRRLAWETPLLDMAALSEEERIAALQTYGVLDTDPEAAFDDLTKLAARLCEAPIALVSLVDRERQWFKSRVGLNVCETPRAVAFCSHAIAGEGPFVVPDATLDPRFASNRLVTGPPGVRFYAGIPLVDPAHAALGTLCVIDVRPRILTPLQLEALQVLAGQVVAQLRLRRTSFVLRDELARQEEVAHTQREVLAQETRLRAELERAHRRSAFLADVGKLLAESLDLTRTFDAVVRLAVPTMADLCSIMIHDGDGALRRVAEATGDHEATSQMRGLREEGPRREIPLPVRAAFEARRPLLFPDYRQWLADRLPADDPYLAVIDHLQVTSAICAPMMVGGRIHGVLNFALQRRSGRAYDDVELETIGELAQRAAVALENARLFAEAESERRRAEEASQAKDRFLAAVSHDLRTPLAAILGWAQILGRKPEDPALVGRAVAVIERNARAQSQLIEDLLDISRVSAGQLRLERQAIDLVAVVSHALEALRPAADERGVRLDCRLDPGAAPCFGDGARVQQVIWNLVSNAIKFSSAGAQVEVRLERERDAAKLVVRDQGKGIAGDLLPHVFEPFRQGRDGTGRRLGGLGLGLAIVKHIVEALGGGVEAHSDGEGRGATFTVRLPLAPEATLPGRGAADASLSSADRAGAAPR